MGLLFAARGAAELSALAPAGGGALDMPLGKRRSLPGPAPAGGPISCTDKKWGKEAAGGCAPLTPAQPPVGLRPKSAAPCPRISGRAYSIPPTAAPRAQCLCLRGSGTVPVMRPGRHGFKSFAALFRAAHRPQKVLIAAPKRPADHRELMGEDISIPVLHV